MQRPRLLAALDGHSERVLTVVTGPAGAGKTVLLSSWTSGRGAAWLSLGPEHTEVTGPAEPLSDREVLRLLPTLLPNAEIAGEL